MYKAAISAFPKCYSLLFSLIIYSSTVGQVTHMHCKPTIVKKAEPLFFRLSANTVDPGGGGGGEGGYLGSVLLGVCCWLLRAPAPL